MGEFDQFRHCHRCGKELDEIVHAVTNEYPVIGNPHDTKHFLCDKCSVKFEKYITKKYDAYFLAYNKDINS